MLDATEAQLADFTDAQSRVEGGVVQHVEVPEGVSVIVRDYDVDGVEDDLLEQDENGDRYIESLWTQKGQPMPKFEIEQYELHTMKYRVEASSEAEAIKTMFEISHETLRSSWKSASECWPNDTE